MEHLPQLCERARTWASLRADGELSELESALLDGHLSRCPPCRRFTRGFESVAGALRATALERPAQLTFRLPRRRAPLRALQSAGLAALALCAAVAGLVASPGRQQTLPKPVAMVAAADSPDHLRQLRRPALVARRNDRAPGDSV